jgi:peptidoglycan/xylan/chitin deacetylase (PgdA/CDA1 family)
MFNSQSSIPHTDVCEANSQAMRSFAMPLFLLRYDTERKDAPSMSGFFEQVVTIHREHKIPATLFCTGGAIDSREEDFKAFFDEVKDDPLFGIQDHSYSHIGVGYDTGKSLDVLRADYEKSIACHEHVFGVRPTGISICGTGGADGKRLQGFDETEKSGAELDMLVDLGVRQINSFLIGNSESRDFLNYESLGHPEVMGYPSAYSDTSWMNRAEHGDPMKYILGQITERAARGEHLPLMLHDWVAWLQAGDQELTHVVKIVDRARSLGYEPVTHLDCYNRLELWA